MITVKSKADLAAERIFSAIFNSDVVYEGVTTGLFDCKLWQDGSKEEYFLALLKLQNELAELRDAKAVNYLMAKAAEKTPPCSSGGADEQELIELIDTLKLKLEKLNTGVDTDEYLMPIFNK